MARNSNGTFALSSPVMFEVQQRGYKSACWVWQRGMTAQGYGQTQDKMLGKKRKDRLAHRWTYEMYWGPIPEGFEVDHLCRVRGCIRPDHLEAVPHRINARRGAKTILTDVQILEIRHLYAMGTKQSELGVRFDCHPCHISRICSGKRGILEARGEGER